MSVYRLDLREKTGRIWPKRPTILSTGLLTVIQNHQRGANKRIPSFKDVAFSLHGEMFAAADEKGVVYLFRVLQNRYKQLVTCRISIQCIAFSPIHKTELVAALSDNTVRLNSISSLFSLIIIVFVSYDLLYCNVLAFSHSFFFVLFLFSSWFASTQNHKK